MHKFIASLTVFSLIGIVSILNSGPLATKTISEEKLDTIVFNHIEFDEAEVGTVLHHLRRQSKRLDPAGKGINIFTYFEDKEKAAQMTVSLSFSKIPMNDLIHYLCLDAGLKYKISGNSVFVGDTLDNYHLKFYPMTAGTVKAVVGSLEAKVIKEFLEGKKAVFNSEATVMFDRRSGNLMIKNSFEQFRELDEIIFRNFSSKSHSTPKRNAALSRKLQSTFINQIDLEAVTILEAIDYLRLRAKEIDPKGNGINIFIDKSVRQNATGQITFSLSGLPIGEVIKYLCKAANVKYRLDRNVIVIYAPVK